MANDPLAAIVGHLHSHPDIGGAAQTWVQAPHLVTPLSADVQRAVTVEDSGGGSGTGQLAMAQYTSGRFDVLTLAPRADLAKQLALEVEEAILETRGKLVVYGAGVPRPSVKFITMVRSGGFISLLDDLTKWPAVLSVYSFNAS